MNRTYNRIILRNRRKWPFETHIYKTFGTFEGGHFVYTMAAKDSSISFDFAGTYTDIVKDLYIVNQLDDGRMVKVTFQMGGSQS